MSDINFAFNNIIIVLNIIASIIVIFDYLIEYLNY